MTQSLTYVEIDVASWIQANSPPNSPSNELTFRFTIDTDFLPLNIDAIPSIKSIEIDPQIVGLGTDLGQRATVTVTFRDHRYQFDGEAYSSGTFWGKFRARYGLKLRGHPLRLIRGTVGQSLSSMETRLFIIESVDGPAASGEYKIIAKDILKYTDGDRAQAPAISNGFIVADITNSATSATLSPAGIGNSEYPASGYVNIGGNEICSFTRSADVLTLTRAQFNTTGVAHTAGDKVQVCLNYNGVDVALIVQDLLVTYAKVASSYIPIADWQTETANYLGVVFTALIAEPTDVATLLNELIEQAALALWWDEVAQKLRLQVLRAIVGASTYTMDNFMLGSLEITEQPDKRLSQVYVYFGKINPTLAQDQIQNFRSTALTSDAQSEIDYGGAAIKKIYSRWIQGGGRLTAQAIGQKQLGRYKDPPRRFNFDLMRYAQDAPVLGGGYNLNSWQLQNITGAQVNVPIQVSRVNPGADRWSVEAEEMLWTAFGGYDSGGGASGGAGSSPDVRTIIFDANENNINLRSRYDQLYPTPTSGMTINVLVNSGVTIGSISTATPAMDVGTWPGGVTVKLTLSGRIEGRGGDGGKGGDASEGSALVGANGFAGGTALYTRQAITLIDASGQIWGGGGGGAGSNGINGSGFVQAGDGGGGGAGMNGGAGGVGGTAVGTSSTLTQGNPGSAGTDIAGGLGGNHTSAGHGGSPANGGTGGGPGLAGGQANQNGTPVNTGGAAGNAIDGVSFVTTSGGAGDRRGGQVN